MDRNSIKTLTQYDLSIGVILAKQLDLMSGARQSLLKATNP